MNIATDELQLRQRIARLSPPRDKIGIFSTTMPDQARGYPGNYRAGRNVIDNHRTRPYHGPLPDSYAFQHDYPSTEPNIILNRHRRGT